MNPMISKQSRRNNDINQKGTMGYAIKKHIEELNTTSSKAMLILFMDMIEAEVSDKSYFTDVRKSILASPFSRGYKMLYNIYLKGMGLSESYYFNFK